MNKHGFVLMETIVVIIVVSVTLLTIFSSYNKILSKTKIENKYDTSEYLYITKYIKNYLIFNKFYTINSCYYYLNINKCDINIKDVNNIKNYLDELPDYIRDLYGVEKVYILNSVNNFGGNELKFDAYMIDYLRKMDVNNEAYIIVEYKKLARDKDYNPVSKYGGTCNDTDKSGCLYETYISSLRW